MASSAPLSRRGGLRIARIAGVDLVADWSLLIIFGLIVIQLGAVAFPAWHPGWSAGTTWLTALLAGVLFFASVALHELAHALVARRNDIPVHRITLFLFGGMAHMEREPPSARSELAMAIVGPLASLAIGVVALVAGSALASLSFQGAASDPGAFLESAGPAATLLLWLGPINILLGLFNLLPGFPLDGGRVLRALLWWSTGSLDRATRFASVVGQGFAWLLMATGVLMAFGAYVPFLGTGPLAGLWMLLIGWFLNNAARASYQVLLVRRAFGHVRVDEVMRPDVRAVDPDMSIARLVDEVLVPGSPSAVVVLDHGHLSGVLELEALRASNRAAWSDLRVADVMVPEDELEAARPDDEAAHAFEALGRREVVPVIGADGQVRGILSRQDLVNWLSLHSDLRFA